MWDVRCSETKCWIQMYNHCKQSRASEAHWPYKKRSTEISSGAFIKIHIFQAKYRGFVSYPFHRQPKTPTLPLMHLMSVPRRMKCIQRYISSFEYNFTGQTFVSLRRDKGMKHLVFSAKTLMRQCLPIQCVQSLFIGVHLTNGMEEVSFRCHNIYIRTKHSAPTCESAFTYTDQFQKHFWWRGI